MLTEKFVRRRETPAPVRFVSAVLFGMVLWAINGCGSIGPGVVNRDRFDYITAISDSWKQQKLLNIVRLRYADVPVFMEVGQVISGYELEGTLSAGGTLGDKDWRIQAVLSARTITWRWKRVKRLDTVSEAGWRTQAYKERA